MSENVKTPWLPYMGEVPATLEYQCCTMAEAVEKISLQYPDFIAYDFMGSKTSYKKAFGSLISN